MPPSLKMSCRACGGRREILATPRSATSERRIEDALSECMRPRFAALDGCEKNLRVRHIHSASTVLPQVFHIAGRLDAFRRRHYAGILRCSSLRAGSSRGALSSWRSVWALARASPHTRATSSSTACSCSMARPWSATASSRALPATSCSRCRWAALDADAAAAAAGQPVGDQPSTGRGPTRTPRRRARSSSRDPRRSGVLALQRRGRAHAEPDRVHRGPGRAAGARRPRAPDCCADWPARNYGYRVERRRAAHDAARRSRLGAARGGGAVAVRSEPGGERHAAAVGADAAAADAPREHRAGLHGDARTTQDATQRASLLRGITEALDEPARDSGWAAALRARAKSELVISTARRPVVREPLRADAAGGGRTRCGDADVAGMESLIRDVLKADDKLGRAAAAGNRGAAGDARPAARERRGASGWSRIAWALRQGALRAYERKARPSIDLLTRSRPVLELIRQLAGPDAEGAAPASEERRCRRRASWR